MTSHYQDTTVTTGVFDDELHLEPADALADETVLLNCNDQYGDVPDAPAWSTVNLHYDQVVRHNYRAEVGPLATDEYLVPECGHATCTNVDHQTVTKDEPDPGGADLDDDQLTLMLEQHQTAQLVSGTRYLDERYLRQLSHWSGRSKPELRRLIL